MDHGKLIMGLNSLQDCLFFFFFQRGWGWASCLWTDYWVPVPCPQLTDFGSGLCCTRAFQYIVSYTCQFSLLDTMFFVCLFAFQYFHKVAGQLLPLAYNLLKRDLFAKVIEDHLASRSTENIDQLAGWESLSTQSFRVGLSDGTLFLRNTEIMETFIKNFHNTVLMFSFAC